MTATLLALAGVGCAPALAACGASAPPGAATATNASTDASSHYATQLKFSQCMRSHGVPGFPDPPQPPVHDRPFSSTSPPTMNPLAPRSDPRSTMPKLVIGAPRTVSPHEAEADPVGQCMRHHACRFPDPTFPPGGGIIEGVGPGVNSQSPAFEHALAECGGA